MRAGAVGVTTSRTFAHRFKDGRPAPSVHTEDEEVLTLADGLRDAGTGVFQLVPDSEQAPETQLDLLRRIAQRSGRPVSFSFLQTPHRPGGWRTILAGIEAAEGEGLTIRGQVLPRPTGGLLGLDLSLHPFSLNPSYRPLAELPLAEKVAAMRDPEVRRRLLAESPTDPHPFFTYVVSEHEQLFVLGDPPDYHPAESDSIAARARSAGVDPLELIYDTLLERDGREILYRPMGNAEGERFESAGRNLLRSDHTVLGLGDGGAHYSMICDAAYPTYFLTYWVRDATPDRRVELPDAIRMLSLRTGPCARLRRPRRRRGRLQGRPQRHRRRPAAPARAAAGARPARRRPAADPARGRLPGHDRVGSGHLPRRHPHGGIAGAAGARRAARAGLT